MTITARSILLTGAALSIASLVAVGTRPASEPARAAETQVSYSQDIAPLLQWKCSTCHQPGGQGFQKSGFDLTSYEGLMKGTKYGRMVIPGDPESSSLMRLIDWRVAPEIRMPHGKKQLSICDRDTVRHWISQGAKDN
ncbi:MAG: hypothetical protein HY245_06575 [Rhizobiales bacterium]|nr:hypothetical protein [Hyphomicrobiales bacterium]MBI3673071.1 hypothetical protein [Hyphomicrobiales bacterium]